MKHYKSLLVSLSLAAGVLFAPYSSATIIYNGGISGGSNTYIGAYNPLTFDSAFFNHGFLPGATGLFSDIFIFTLNPDGFASMNANFVPTGRISGFLIELLSATGTTGCGALGTACSTLATGAVLATGIPGLDSSNIGFVGLTTGTYAIRISGNVTDAPVLYSGQLVTLASIRQVPEPGSLALLGLGLLVAGATLRRRS